MNNNNLTIPEDIRSEFQIDADGKVFTSQRAVARFCGVDEKSIRALLSRIKSAELEGSKIAENQTEYGVEGAEQKQKKTQSQKLPQQLQPFAGQEFKDSKLPDILVMAIIEYYAFDASRYCTKEAKLVFRAFAAIGIRAWIQNELNWEKPQPQPVVDDTWHQDIDTMVEQLYKIVFIHQERIENFFKIVEIVERHEFEIRELKNGLRELKDVVRENRSNLFELADIFSALMERVDRVENQLQCRTVRNFAMTVRSKINFLVHKYCERNNVQNWKVWKILYEKLNSLYGYDAKSRAIELSCSCIDAVEADGLINNLYVVASEMLV